MKPPSFTYHAPVTTAEALDALAEAGDEGKVLAGGQSLIPLMNYRLATPEHLVDINRIEDLDRIEIRDGEIVVGARVRHARLEHDGDAFTACPLLRQALVHVAHPVIRNRGTVCGSLAHADPSGELTAVAVLLGGTAVLASATAGPVRRREVAAADFFHGPLEADVRPGELLEEIRFPVMAPHTGSAFVEVARRHGDYAVCGVAAVVELDDDRVASAGLGFVSVGPVPIVVDLTPSLGGSSLDDSALAEAGRLAEDAVRPASDLHASADYRRHLAGVLTRRAVREAAANVGRP